MANPDIDDFDFPPAHAEDTLSFANILGASDEDQQSLVRQTTVDGIHDHLSSASHRSGLGEVGHDASFPDLQLGDEATFAHLFPPPPDLVYSNTSSGHSPASTGSWGMSHDSPTDPAYIGNSINGDYEGAEHQDSSFVQGNHLMTKNTELDQPLQQTITEADIARLFAGSSFLHQPNSAAVVPSDIGNSHSHHWDIPNIINMRGSVGIPAGGQSFIERTSSILDPTLVVGTLGAESNAFAWNARQNWSGLPSALVDPPLLSMRSTVDHNSAIGSISPAGTFPVDVLDLNTGSGPTAWNNMVTDGITGVGAAAHPRGTQSPERKPLIVTKVEPCEGQAPGTAPRQAGSVPQDAGGETSCSSEGNHRKSSLQKSGGVNLHNKVEKRYRFNVKNALEGLRDSVPRLREVYGTSLDWERTGQDVEDENGLMGGMERLGKPTKQTIMLGARMYIEYLEGEVEAGRAARHRHRALLGRFLDGEDLHRWEQEEVDVMQLARNEHQNLLERKSAERAILLAAKESADKQADKGATGEGNDDSSEDLEPTPLSVKHGKKRSRVDDEDMGPVKRGRKPKQKGSKANATGATATVVYSIGLAYTFFPRASKLLPQIRTGSGSAVVKGVVGPGKVLSSSSASAAQILQRSLPATWVPHTDDLLDWAGVALVTALLVLAVWLVRSEPAPRVEGEVASPPSDASWGTSIPRRLRRFLGVEGDNLVMQHIRQVVGGATKPTYVGRALFKLQILLRSRSDLECAMLRALYQGDAALWPRQRRIIDAEKVAKVIGLEFADALALFRRIKPQTRSDPILAMSDELSYTHLKDIGASLFAAMAVPADRSLSTAWIRHQITEALVGTVAMSEVHTLGLVLLAVCQLAVHRNPPGIEPVATAIAKALSHGVKLKSGWLLLHHLQSPDASPTTMQHDVLASTQAARDLDILLEVCLRSVVLLQGGHSSGQAVLRIRQLLMTSAFRRICQDVRDLSGPSEQSPENSDVSEAESDAYVSRRIDGIGLSECTIRFMERLAAPIQFAT